MSKYILSKSLSNKKCVQTTTVFCFLVFFFLVIFFVRSKKTLLCSFFYLVNLENVN